MQDFSKVPIHTDEDLNEWLTFHEMNSTLIAVGTLGKLIKCSYIPIGIHIYISNKSL